MDTVGPILRDISDYGYRVTQVGHMFSPIVVGLVKMSMGRVPAAISNETVNFIYS